jgi:glycosyltransferase involved in cell wall biosynthesis
MTPSLIVGFEGGAAVQYFIVPRLDGPISGGTLYNRMLMAGLQEVGCACEVLPVDGAMAGAGALERDRYWVDSLYLDQWSELARALWPGTRLGLIVHYLPTLLSHGEGIGPGDLTATEAAALRTATMFLVPSPWMRGILHRLLDPVRPVLTVEPGRPPRPSSFVPGPPVRAAMVANLVEGKGVDRFLASLAEQLRETDDLNISIVGGKVHGPAYAERCQALARAPGVRGRVRFLGELSHDQTLRVMAASNLLISCSRMESFGMALMEARVLGVPILAERGGHVAAIVEQDSGGELFANAEELVATLLGIGRDPAEHRRRLALARARRWTARPWAEAAREFVSQLETLDKTGAHAETIPHEGLRDVG